MHSITLSFATLTELAAALAAVRDAEVQHDVKPAPAPAKPKAEKPAPVVAAAPVAPAPPASAPAASALPSTDYPTLQKAVFKLAGLSREVVGEVAASFGVKTFKDLDSSKWGDALTAVEAETEKLAVPA